MNSNLCRRSLLGKVGKLMRRFLKRIALPLAVIALIVAYILVAGRSGSCGACSAIVNAVGAG